MNDDVFEEYCYARDAGKDDAHHLLKAARGGA